MTEFDPKRHLQQLPPSPYEDAPRALAFLAEKAYASDPNHLTGCTSYIQRKLQCGYNHAAAIMEVLEEQGHITAADNYGARRLKRTD